MSRDEAVMNRLSETGIIPVVVMEDSSDAAALGDALTRGGLNAAEVTFRTAAAEGAIRSLKREYPDLLCGAGTILSIEQAKTAADAGAEFVVSPCFDKEVVEYLNGKIRQTEWVRECIEKRNSTLLKISQQLFLFQKEFFLNGNQALRPLRMSDVAEALEVHESTVSRAVKGKYLQCAYGVYPMSYFFRSGITSEEGKTVATDRIKDRIREIIDGEDRKKPLSDQKICDMLEKEGLAISRRAVAKYRDEMGIAATSKRRTYEE